MMIVGMPPRPRCEASFTAGPVPAPCLRLWFNCWPPTDNHKGGPVIRGRRVGYRSFTETKAFYGLVQCAKIEFKLPKVSGWVITEFRHIFRSAVHGDPGNYFKVTHDALQRGGLIENDKFALPLVFSVKYLEDFAVPGIQPPEPGMEVLIMPAPPERIPARYLSSPNPQPTQGGS
jgi:hypothetical protein